MQAMYIRRGLEYMIEESEMGKQRMIYDGALHSLMLLGKATSISFFNLKKLKQ